MGRGSGISGGMGARAESECLFSFLLRNRGGRTDRERDSVY